MAVNYYSNQWLVDRLVLKSIYFLRFHENIYCVDACGVNTIFNGYFHGSDDGFYSNYCIYRVSRIDGGFIIVFGNFYDFIRVNRESIGYMDRSISGLSVHFDRLVDAFETRFSSWFSVD